MLQSIIGLKLMSTIDELNVLSDGYLNDKTIEAELFAFGQTNSNIIQISYDDMESAAKRIMELKGPTICLSGPSSFSYERAVLFSLLNQNKFIEDGFPSLSSQSYRLGKWSWVSASAYVDVTATIGAMCVLLSEVAVHSSVTIGNFCWLGERAHMGFGAKMERHSTLLKGCQLGAGVCLKRHCEISTNIGSDEEASGIIDTDFFGGRAYIRTQ